MTQPSLQTQTERELAFGYPWTPYRVEWRPTYGLDDRQTLTRQMDALQRAGVKAWWYSAAAKGSYPLFKSEHLPYRDDADDELFQWLTAECHDRGISIISWEYLNTAPMLAQQKPEWRYRWLDHDGDDSDRREHQFVCYNSPYGDLLMKYCVEVVDHLGFDGIWFDGSTLYGVGTKKQRVACCCDFCNEKYQQETGREIPTQADIKDPAFRRYVDWRYRDFMDYWGRLADHVNAEAPGKLIAYNHFNRLAQGWRGGCPLWHTPINAMISTEVGAKHNHLLLHVKYHRAINQHVPVEIWDYLRDGVTDQPANQPEPDPTACIYNCLAAATEGGYMSYGLPDSPENTERCMTAISAAVDPVAPHVGGEPPRCVGLVLSGATKDFYYDSQYTGWKHVHGVHNLLNGLHLPSEVLLDNTIDQEHLDRYQAVVLPDIRCLGDEAAEAIRGYVESGGTVLAIGEIGTHDLNGDRRDTALLDDLFGIARRHEQELTASTLDFRGGGFGGDGLPDRFKISGHCLPIDAAPGANALATVRYPREPQPRRWNDQGLIPPEPDEIEAAALVAKDHGKGRTILVRCQVGEGYAHQPNRRSRAVIERLLADRIERPFTTDAPSEVVISPWRQGDRLAVHALRVPSALLRFHGDAVDPSDIYWPEEDAKLAAFTVTVPGNWQRAASPQGNQLPCRREDDALEVTIEGLSQHALAILE